MALLIKNARIVSEYYDINESLDVYIVKGMIKKIGQNLQYDCKIIDADNMLLMPGLIDMSCKICEAGYENKNNIITVSQSAAAGGFTSITTSPNTQPIIDNKTVVEYVYSKATEHSKVNVYPFGSVTKGCKGEEISEIGQMISKGVLGVSDGGKSICNAMLLKNIMLYLNMFDVPLITHCMDEDLSDGGVVNSGYMSTKLGLKGSPSVAEEIVVARNLVMATHLENKLHIAHVTTEGSVQHIRNAKQYRNKITSATCPHYFTLTEKEVDGYNTFAKVSPPLRTDKDIKAIIDGLRDGTIDVIATGHTPATYDTKNAEFDKATNGIPSLETALMVTYTALVKNDSFTPLDIAEKMSANPAKILGLKTKGIIKEGMDADLIIVDDKNEYAVEASEFYSKAKYSPYDGMSFYGKCVKTICGGEVI